MLGPRGHGAILVETLGNPGLTIALGAQLENEPHHGRFSLVDDANHRPTVGADVVVPEYPPSSHVPRQCFTAHCVVGALAGFLALQFVGERREAEHDLVGRAVQGALPILEVEPDPNPSGDQLLQRIRGLDRFAPKATLLAHDEGLKRW